VSDHNPPSQGSDTRPAITGFILGAIALLVILTSIVKLTNAHYAAETPAPAATQSK
jgi:hypothetical protein